MGMVLMIVGIGVMAAFISEVSATLVESRMNRSIEDNDFKHFFLFFIKLRSPVYIFAITYHACSVRAIISF